MLVVALAAPHNGGVMLDTRLDSNLMLFLLFARKCIYNVEETDEEENRHEGKSLTDNSGKYRHRNE